MTVGSKRVMAAAGASAVALVVLAGCTGSDPAPTVSSTSSAPTTSASPTTSATSAAPTTSAATDGIPAAAKANTPAGAEAFVRYFEGRLNDAWIKPDPALLVNLCDATSKSCQGYRETADALLKDHQHYDSKPIEIGKLTTTDSSGDTHRIAAQIVINEANIVDQSGATVESFKREAGNYVFYVRWEGSGWVINDVKVG